MRLRFSSRAAIGILCFSLGAFAFQALAQAPDGSGGGTPSDNASYEVGFHVGDILPNQIGGLSEIIGLGGLRIGTRIAPLTYFEGGFITGNGAGAQWKDVHADVRMDIPVENLVGFAYLGADTLYFKGAGKSTQVLFGGHVGGGLQAHFTGNVWFRGDMKFSISPGTSLYVGAGLEYRIPDK